MKIFNKKHDKILGWINKFTVMIDKTFDKTWQDIRIKLQYCSYDEWNIWQNMVRLKDEITMLQLWLMKQNMVKHGVKLQWYIYDWWNVINIDKHGGT